eukprot:CAMPEP_0185732744 /NCGR_PEP_ID=MMETSP1171-20130828/17353_1 /TAXON_ID=374046 /ORGANISM="Helicotheca tamensis, Strain CCMP826" /LENGTH=360 /DNA_ID=CAMNT_0028402313 /DNA_START=122 /DNA_END=1201 /DNA_ORIENTATION=+
MKSSYHDEMDGKNAAATDGISQMENCEIHKADENNKKEMIGEDVPSNEYLLNVAFISFLGFTITQASVAVVAQSQAMIGDSAAMAVDAMTYLFNMYAERQKNKPIEDDGVTPRAVLEHQRKILRLKLEIIPPVISVFCLLGVTCYVLRDAISTLTDPEEEAIEDQPNVHLMFFFSALNLALDVFNVSCFARAKKALGYLVIKKDIERYGDDKECIKPIFQTGRKSSIVDADFEIDSPTASASYDSITDHGYETHLSISSDVDDVEDEENVEDKINLNMCSAYTHVFADTLRSIAVVIAAGLAAIFECIRPEASDSVAAIVVSFIILISLGPLLVGLFVSIRELRALYRTASEAKDREAEI